MYKYTKLNSNSFLRYVLDEVTTFWWKLYVLHSDRYHLLLEPQLFLLGKNLSDFAQLFNFTDEILIQIICFPVLLADNIRGVGLFIYLFTFFFFFQWANLLRSGHFSQDFCLVWIWEFLNTHCPLKKCSNTGNVIASRNWQLIILKQKG